MIADRALRRRQTREQLLERARQYLDPAFMEGRLAPLVHPIFAGTEPPTLNGEVVRARETGRLTLRYRVADRGVLYAKVYNDGLGPRGRDVLEWLWRNGMGSNAPYQVPQPLAFFPEENLLVMSAACGTPLEELLNHADDAEVEEGIRRAAGWLAALHDQTLPGLAIEPPCERIKLFKLADMLGKAAAKYPEQAGVLLALLQQIRELAPPAMSRLAPSHGEYTPANVFIHRDHVAVIDLDRLRLSDPAKDVAMFAHRLRSLLFHAQNRGDRGARLASAFVEAYRERADSGLHSLPYYQALFALKAFAKHAKDRAPGDPVRARLEAFYLEAFERAVEAGTGRAVPPSPRLRDGASRLASREELRTWIVRLSDRDFLRQYVQGAVVGDQSAAPPDLGCELTVAQHTGTGRLTLKYDFGSSGRIFAKLYTDGLGQHSYQVLRTLWKAGFDAASRFQVPEPLAFLPEHNLVLMRGAVGQPLSAALTPGSVVDLVRGARAAARWLAALHRCALRMGDAEPEWDSLKIFRAAVRLIKAAAASPERRDALLDVLHALRTRLAALPRQRPIVQTHGRYHWDHVFVDAETTTVIDLDRSRPSDPAKDVAEFVRVLRQAAFRSGYDLPRADEATRAFLEEYESRFPEGAAAVPYYWSAFLVLSLLGAAKKLRSEARSEDLLDFHRRELERVMEIA